MKIKVGINGMGRIGRMILRSIIENNNQNIEIKHINNKTNTEACSTLIAIPSNLPLRDGIISPIALEAPVEVGTID